MEPFSSKNQHISSQELQSFSLGTLSSEDSHRVSDHLAFCPRCRLAFAETMQSIEVPMSTPNAPIESRQSAESIPGYRHLERIAQGGMGSVYLAIQDHTNKQVAIKVIKQREASGYGSERKKRLVREAHALTKIDHPNIVHPLEVVLVNDSPALIMEYIQGQPLHRWAKQHKPDIRTAAVLTKELAQAVLHAHQRGVIHCDLKPQNILVTNVDSKPSLKIIDFGLAKLSDEDWSITSSGDVLGTPAYMAPEQTSGSVLKATPTIDVYGLGTILYELLTGRPPFEAPTSAKVLAMVARQSPVRPSKIDQQVPPSLDRICLKCLEKRPEDRYASAKLLAEDLQAFLDDKPILAREPSGLAKLRRLVQANPLLSFAFVFSALLAVTSLIAFVNLRKEFLANSKMTRYLQAVEIQKLSEANRADEAEQTVLNELRTSLSEATERLFGATPDKEDTEWTALERIAERWERFADRNHDSMAGRLVQSEALMRIGSIHALLGQLDAAEPKLLSALTALPETFSEAPKESQRLAVRAETHWHLAKCFFDAGKATDSEQSFQEAWQNSQQAISLQPQGGKHRLLSARIQCDYGTMLLRTSRSEDAQQKMIDSISELEKFIESSNSEEPQIVSSNQSIDATKQICASKIALAQANRMRGEHSKAIALLESLSTRLADLENRSPEDPMIAMLNSTQGYAIGMCQLEQGKFEAARHSFLKAMAHQERLLAEYPSRQDLQKNYGSLCGSLAVVSVRLNRPEDAFKFISKSFEINSDLAQKHPGNLEYVGEKSKSLTNLVAILANANRLDEAATYGHELIELQSKLAQENPNRAEFAYGLAASLNIVASVLGKLGQDEQATTYYNRSRCAYADLIQHNPQVHAYRMGLTSACLSKADFARAIQNWQQAIEAYSQAIETIHNFKATSMALESNLLARAYLGQAVAFKSLGQFAESRACAQLGAQTIMPWKDSPQGQEVLRMCLDLSTNSTVNSGDKPMR